VPTCYRQAGNAGRTRHAAGGRQAERQGFVIEITPGGAALGRCRARGRIHVHAAHLRKVDHHSAVADREPGNAVPAPAHGDQDLVFAREFHGPHYVRDARAADNHRRRRSIIPL